MYKNVQSIPIILFSIITVYSRRDKNDNVESLKQRNPRNLSFTIFQIYDQKKKEVKRIKRKACLRSFETFPPRLNRISRANKLDDFELKIIARNRNYRFANCHGRKLISAGIIVPAINYRTPINRNEWLLC